MSRKKTKKNREWQELQETKQPKPGRPRAKNRAEVVLAIVATDSTFAPQQEQWRFGPPLSLNYQPCWVGRCIHCNTKIFVTPDGWTDATIEHIQPLCNDGAATDPRNLALACKRCNNEKGVRHDMHAGKGGRADEVIAQLQIKRDERWRSAP